MRKITLSIMAILVMFSGLNISVAEIETNQTNPEIKRILPNGKQTKDPGTVTKDEGITLDVSYPESNDKTMIISIGDVFTFNEEKTKNLMKEKQGVTVSYQKEQKQLTITWKTTNKESAVFSLKAIKAGQAKLKAVGQQEKIKSNTLEITIQDPIPTTPKPEDSLVVEDEKQKPSDKENVEDKTKEEAEDPLVVEDEKQQPSDKENIEDKTKEETENPLAVEDEKQQPSDKENIEDKTNEENVKDKESESVRSENNNSFMKSSRMLGEQDGIAWTAEYTAAEKNSPEIELLQQNGDKLVYTFAYMSSSIWNGTAYGPIGVVYLKTKDGNGKEKRIDHLWDKGTSTPKTFISSHGLHIHEGLTYIASSEARKQNVPYTYSIGKDSNGNNVAIRATQKLSNGKYNLKLILRPSEDKRRIIHEYYIENLQKTRGEFTPHYSVDTELDKQDNVPLRAIGDNRGIYMATENYRLDYKFPDQDGPVNWVGGDNKKWKLEEFTPANASGTGQEIYRYPKDTILAQNVDTGIHMKWPKMSLDPGEIAHLQWDVGIQNTIQPELELDNNGSYTEEGYQVTGTWKEQTTKKVGLYYTVNGGEPQKVGDYTNDTPNESTPFTFTIPYNQVEKGMDYNIDVFIENEDFLTSDIKTIKIRPSLTFEERMFDENGKEIKEITPGETVNYDVLVDSGYITKDTGTYDGVMMTLKYDTHLEPPTSLLISDENANPIGTATYNAATNAFEIKLNPGTPRSTKVKVMYKAKVKEDVENGECIIAQLTVSGAYSTGDEINVSSDSLKVKVTGWLNFISAPSIIDFGSNMEISPQDQIYYPINVNMPLAVQDNRSLSQKKSWVMKAKLDKALTGKTTGSTMDGLYYRYNGNDSIISENASVEIYKKETTDRQVINISDSWRSQDGDGLYLKVRAGIAKHDAYEGTISWTLQDVPMNQ